VFFRFLLDPSVFYGLKLDSSPAENGRTPGDSLFADTFTYLLIGGFVTDLGVIVRAVTPPTPPYDACFKIDFNYYA
jgi:hypothetical protein